MNKEITAKSGRSFRLRKKKKKTIKVFDKFNYIKMDFCENGKKPTIRET